MNIYRTQLVYRNTDDVHAIIIDNATFEEAKEKLEQTNAGMEVDVQIINIETGEEVERKN